MNQVRVMRIQIEGVADTADVWCVLVVANPSSRFGSDLERTFTLAFISPWDRLTRNYSYLITSQVGKKKKKNTSLNTNSVVYISGEINQTSRDCNTSARALELYSNATKSDPDKYLSTLSKNINAPCKLFM